MKILVTAEYVSGAVSEGGSGRFMKCVIDELESLGHDVTATSTPDGSGEYDFIIVSHHDQFEAIKDNPAHKVYISHGIVADERFLPGADKYISISEEVRTVRLTQGISSVIVSQPVEILKQIKPSAELRKILIIKSASTVDEPFNFLNDKYDVRMSDPSTPIEDQIKWADLCITLGRGVIDSMAQGKPVLVADQRDYMGPLGDGYVNKENIKEIARCNFSGRRYNHEPTQEWVESELEKYNADDSDFLYQYVTEKHDVKKIASRYIYNPSFSFGAITNDAYRMNTVLLKSALPGEVHYDTNPESATAGLNRILDVIDKEGSDIAVLAHQDMYFRSWWLAAARNQLSMLPDSWVVAGIVGKDMHGRICGNIHDMRIVNYINTGSVHEFPEPAASFDECVIIVNMKTGFRFDESLDGFDLYGTLCVLQAWEMGGTAWVVDAFAEHYCMRPFTWFPDDDFKARYKVLYDRFNDRWGTVDSTVFVNRPRFETSAAA